VNDAQTAWAIGPHWVDAVIALTLVEVVLLWLVWRRRGRGPAPGDWLPQIASGLCLMVALRAALAGWGGAWILGCLTASGLLHGADLWRRWR
jgi:hypothetical protein